MRLKHQRMSKHKVTQDMMITFILRFLFVAIIIGLIWAQNNLVLTKKFVFSSPDVPKNFVGYKIVHVSDLCNSSVSITNQVKRCDPDIIIVSGGYFDTNGNSSKSVKQVEALTKIAPVYYVYGLNDPEDILSSTNAINMSNNLVELETEVLDAATFIEKAYGKRIINEANKGNEEAQAYMDYIDTKLKENANTTVALIGLDRHSDRETGADTALDQVYSLLMQTDSEYSIGILGNARAVQKLPNTRLRLAFTGGTFGTNNLHSEYKKGVYGIGTVQTFFCGGIGTYNDLEGNKIRRIFNFPEIQCITLSDGTIQDKNPLENFIGMFWSDVGTVFDNDADFSVKKIETSVD